MVYTNLDFELYYYPTTDKLDSSEPKSSRIVPANTSVHPHLGQQPNGDIVAWKHVAAVFSVFFNYRDTEDDVTTIGHHPSLP